MRPNSYRKGDDHDDNLIILVVKISVISLYATADAGWVLYDNFDSDAIDTEKWRIDDSSADISIENGEVRFSYKEGYERDSSWLEIFFRTTITRSTSRGKHLFWN